MNPIELAQSIEKRYRRYLQTTFYFKDRELRESFESVLISGRLSKGPYLEATPIFKRTQTSRALFPELLGFQPDEGFLKAVDRHLYKHQEEAIRRVHQGHNVVVATGTGSGKTEAFLYPILLHLYREFHDAGELCPGVRALILYPMNALANDQRERLAGPPSENTPAGILWTLQQEQSPFHFKFGQYIGETPENDEDGRRHAHAHQERRLPGERVFRSEMRAKPPHILLTNYSMLEYLLLRPDDSPLFDKGQARWWTFLVLDEAHQYRGSRGIEMAMLIRRLKQRLREGDRTAPFRCIATSATLGGNEDKKAVAEFAEKLFGEEFQEDDVILGDVEPIPQSGSISLDLNDYTMLQDTIQGNVESKTHLAEVAVKLGTSLENELVLPEVIGGLLQHDRRPWSLREFVAGNPHEVQEIADRVFDNMPDEERVGALSVLVELLMKARDPQSKAPLLSSRYHVFLRSLEGAFVSYWPQKKVILERKKEEEGGGAVFEIALCRECGQHYFVCQKDFNGGRLTEANRDPGHDNFGATFLRPLEGEDDLDEDDDDAKEEDHRKIFYLCVQCGEARTDKPTCGHDNFLRVMKERPHREEDKADQLARCGACGYNASGHDPVREIVYGADGPHAVIATTLYQNLPEGRKKVLAFADGRQEAAFFAWYLGSTYADILSRNVIRKILQGFENYPTKGISLKTIADRAFNNYRDMFRQKAYSDETTDRKTIWRSLYRELLTEEQRISLEGVGLLRWSIEWPRWFKVPTVLLNSPWSLTETEAWYLLFLLLDTLRADRAVELRTEADVSLNWKDLNWQATQRRITKSEDAKLNYGERRWCGKTGRRVRFLVKILMSINGAISEKEAVEQAIDTLRKNWDGLEKCDENAPSSQEHLLAIIEGDTRRLNPEWLRVLPVTEEDVIFQCNTCRRLQTVSVRGICARHRCRGTLEAKRLKDIEPNHYRLLYQENLAGSLVVEEHTAQLDHEKAREFQRRFRNNEIHVLSCSTTFELGVDLGNLDTTFLRNVPPETFNYAQRVGRVGRRGEIPGFAITYCRRNPHDLYHFSEPLRMINGKIQPPVLSLKNEKIIARHITATTLSAFFRFYKERFKTVENLCRDLSNPSCVSDLRAFLIEHRAELENSLLAIVPSSMFTDVGLSDGTWIQAIAGESSRLSYSEAEVSSDYKKVIALEETLAKERKYDSADWAKDRAGTIASEDVLSFLSRKAVIPKYGFPVDVVELDTQRTTSGQEASEVLLQRDLSIAISEFAPTSSLIANKKVWTSYGLKKVAEREWDRWWYARCTTHARFERKRYEGEERPPPFYRCCERMKIYQYIEPKFGFVTSQEKPKEPTARPIRVFTTRPYFAGFKDKKGEEKNFGAVILTTVSPGYMVVVCEGRRSEGFFICSQCGAGFRSRKEWRKGHKTPQGVNCSVKPATLENTRVSLGHELVTDVLKIQFCIRPSMPIEEPTWFAISLAYALVEGAAEILGAPSNDLNATVAYGSENYPIPPIILYDNVPGGAGLVGRLEDKDILRECLESAKGRVGGACGCGKTDSCYGCLRSYRNQFAHQYLQRGPVLHYLDGVLAKW